MGSYKAIKSGSIIVTSRGKTMSLEKTKNPRTYVSEIAFGAAAVSLITTIWEAGHLMVNRPTQPDYSTGFVYPFKVKGPRVFISGADANCYSLSIVLFILCFACMAYALGPRSSPTDVTLDENGSFHVGSRNGASGDSKILLASIIATSGFFLLFGRFAADFLAGHGVVLNFGGWTGAR